LLVETLTMPPIDSAPPFVTSYEPLAATIHWVEGSDGFTLVFLKESTRTVKFDTARPGAVRTAIDRLIVEADAFTDCVGSWTDKTSPERKAADQALLKEAAEAVGESLFPGTNAARFLETVETSGAEFIGVTAIHGDRHVFPWNLIRFAGVDRWLGEIACFSLAREGQDGLRETAARRDVSGVVAGYADDDNLLSGLPSPTHPTATQAEYNALLQVADAGVRVLGNLPAGPMNAVSLAATQDWLAKPLHIFHFNAHASAPGHAAGFTEIGLRLGARLSGEDVVGGAHVTGAVVLDVCNSAHGADGWWDNCLAACFHRRGVPVVLAATSTVNDAFGVEFSEALYGEVPLHDYRLFAAMRSAQKILLERTKHPMALYYTYEGSPRFELGGF